MLCGGQDFWTDPVPTVPAQSFPKCNPIAFGHNNSTDAGQVVLGLFSAHPQLCRPTCTVVASKALVVAARKEDGSPALPQISWELCFFLEALVQQGVIWAGYTAQAVPSSSIKKPKLVELVLLIF